MTHTTVTLKHPTYNSYLVDRCRKLNGKWDKDTATWHFDPLVSDKVAELDQLFNADIVAVEITAKEYISQHTDPVDFCGYTIARAFNRDSGAKLGDNIAMLSGDIGSGGSWKNWRSYVASQSVFRLKLSKNLLNKFNAIESNNWEIKEI